MQSHRQRDIGRLLSDKPGVAVVIRPFHDVERGHAVSLSKDGRDAGRKLRPLLDINAVNSQAVRFHHRVACRTARKHFHVMASRLEHPRRLLSIRGDSAVGRFRRKFVIDKRNVHND